MTPLFKKLNFKEHKNMLIINTPKSFDLELERMKSNTKIYGDIENISEADFAMIFASKQNEVDDFTNAIFPKLKGDAVLWICYPKGSSKNYKCEFNRDTGWTVLGQLNMEPVRQVAIDEDWSALRFRKVEFIKTITRRTDFALTAEAKKRTTAKI